MQQVVLLLGGLAFLFWGMEQLSGNLSGMFRPKIGTVGAADGFLTGFIWTILVQSSSTVAACLISLAQAGVFSVLDCLPMLLGSNVGTTVTVWLLSVVRTFSLDGVGLLLSFLALLFKKKKRISGAAFGLGLALTGMELLQQAAAPLRQTALLFRKPLSAFFGAAGFTAVIQSSAVTIGAMQMMDLTMPVAAAAVLGANVGTCGTGLLTAAMLGREGKAVALLELGINLFSAVLLLPAVRFLPEEQISAGQIAAIHTLVNAVTAAVLLPIFGYLRGNTWQSLKEKQSVR